LLKVIRLFSIVQKEIYKFVNPNLTKYINLKDIRYFLGQILHPNHIQYGIIGFVCLHGNKLPNVKWRLINKKTYILKKKNILIASPKGFIIKK
jgi:hypothetical protein